MKKLILILCFVLIASTAFAGRLMFLSGGGNDSSVTGVPAGTDCIAARDGSGVAVCSSTIDGIDIIVPNGASNTLDTAGQVAVDTSSDMFHWFGGADRAISYKQFLSVVVPSVAATDDMILMKLPFGITALSLDCIVSAATSATINIQECDSAGANCVDMATSDLACDTDGANTATFNNAVADSGDWLKLDVASIDGTPGTLTVTLTYSVVAD